jgi:perosamine synthetase
MSTIVWDERYSFDKVALMQKLDQAGIDTRPFFHPLSSLPAYQNVSSAKGARERNKTTYRICSNGINLPSALCLQREQVQTVCKVLKPLFGA